MADTTSGKKPLNELYPEAYRLMIGFYCNPNFHDSDPDCRPADNVLMAIQYALTHRSATDGPPNANVRDVEAAFKEGIETGYQCGKADEATTDQWQAAWLASDAAAGAAVAS